MILFTKDKCIFIFVFCKNGTYEYHKVLCLIKFKFILCFIFKKQICYLATKVVK